jgi:hypothetical protein
MRPAVKSQVKRYDEVMEPYTLLAEPGLMVLEQVGVARL